MKKLIRIKPVVKPKVRVRPKPVPVRRVRPRVPASLPAKDKRLDRPDYFGAASPDILFVVDPMVGKSGSDEAPKATKPITKPQMDFLTKYCTKHGIPRNKAAILRACPPVTALQWASAKKMSDHLKIHRDELTNAIEAAKPKIIVAMGGKAAQQVANRAVQITKARGTPVHNEEFGCVVFMSLGLGHVIRIPEVERTFDSDMATLKKVIDAGYSLKYQDDVELNYSWGGVPEIRKLIEQADAGPVTLSVDTEYTGGEYYQPKSKLLTVQLCAEAGTSYCIPIDYDHTFDGERVPTKAYTRPASPEQRTRIVKHLRKLLTHPNVSIVGQSFKGDVLVLRHKIGIDCTDNFQDDTISLIHGVDENMKRKDLDEITRQWVPELSGYADDFNRDPCHQGKTRMDLVPPQKMLWYSCGDTDACLRAYERLTEELKKDPKNYRVYKKVVMPAHRAFARFEDHGFVIDKAALRLFEKEVRKHQASEYKRIVRMVPKEIRDVELADKWRKRDGQGVLKPASITRPGFLLAMLFNHKKGLRLKPHVFTKGTKDEPDPKDRIPSTSGKHHLAYFEDEYPFVKAIMEYIKAEKLLGTYVGTESDDGETLTGFYRYIINGRIRPTYLLHQTVTGRSASQRPNGQNFPKRGKLAKRYREIFVAPPGYVLLEVDFSQMELRVAAVMAQDAYMLELYANGKDIHAATAAATMSLTLEEFFELPKEERDHKRFQAKAINFGFLYGMGWRKFITYAKTEYKIDFTEEEAQNIQRTFFRTYASLKPWHNAMMEWVNQHGWVRALDGRVRHLPSVYSPDEMISSMAQRQAINSPVQAFGSDCGLIAIDVLVNTVPNELVQPIGFIHDALVCLAPEGRAQEAAIAIKRCMENVPLVKLFGLKLPIPIIAEAAVGKNLAHMLELSDKDLADPDQKTWTGIVTTAHKSWRASYAKAKDAGKPDKDLPKHPLGENYAKYLPRRKPRVVLKRVRAITGVPIKPRTVIKVRKRRVA